MVHGVHGDVVEATAAQQGLEIAGLIERLPNGSALDDEVCEQLVLPCPAIVLGAPGRHAEPAARSEHTTKSGHSSFGIGKEEDPEPAQDHREPTVG